MANKILPKALNTSILINSIKTLWLLHWDQNNMNIILQMAFWYTFFECCFWIQISQKFASKGLIDNKSAWVFVMAWFLTGTKPLPEPMMDQFTGALVAGWYSEMHTNCIFMTIHTSLTLTHAISWRNNISVK